MSDTLTIGEFLAGILPRLRTDTEFPRWPPDCFALCLALLKRTGAYSQVLRDWPPDRGTGEALEHWTSRARELGEKRRTAWKSEQSFDELSDEWRLLGQSFSRPLGDVDGDRPLCEALMKLAAVADEASEGVGAPVDQEAEEDDVFLVEASRRLKSQGTVCSEIEDTRLRVLPRMHTPQSGLTDRSLSLYLSLCDPCEVTPGWISTPFIQRDSINLLMIPWPLEVLVRQFRDVTDSAATELPDDFGFFTYDFLPDEDLIKLVESLHNEAKRILARIDGVVLPELAITDQQFRALRDKLPPECFLVCGIGRGSIDDQRGINEVRLSFPPLEEVNQRKHHPWKMNEAQVVQYGLGGVLAPSREWWEYADFADRRLNFISMSAELVLSVLICEDLARPDPVADLVRAVGPNLVIALLMDGPQTKERWAARYATVLADDPGCSVLSLTSLGLAQLSRPQSGRSRSRVVALWKDAFGSATEIELPQGFDAVAASLSIRYREEYTADGRGDEAAAAFPMLSGVHPISAARADKWR